jgi:hypothetical protein
VRFKFHDLHPIPCPCFIPLRQQPPAILISARSYVGFDIVSNSPVRRFFRGWLICAPRGTVRGRMVAHAKEGYFDDDDDGDTDEIIVRANISETILL